MMAACTGGESKHGQVEIPNGRHRFLPSGVPTMFRCTEMLLFLGIQGDESFATFVCGSVFEQLAVAHDLSGKSEFCLSGEVRLTRTKNCADERGESCRRSGQNYYGCLVEHRWVGRSSPRKIRKRHALIRRPRAPCPSAKVAEGSSGPTAFRHLIILRVMYATYFFSRRSMMIHSATLVATRSVDPLAFALGIAPSPR